MADQPHISPVRPVLLDGMTQTVSGTYHPLKRERGAWRRFFNSAVLRLDIDNWYPLQHLSCTVENDAGKTDLLFSLKKTDGMVWSATRIKKTGDDNPIGKSLTVTLLPRKAHARPHIALTISNAHSETTFVCQRVSSTFHKVTVEIDRVKNVREATGFSPRSHNVRPSVLSGKTITLKDVFNRAGFNVAFSPDRDTVPEECAGKDRAWNNRELHDAMQTYWAHFAKTPQWSLWVFYATRYKESPFTGGLMFDTDRQAQRRGIALFDQSPLFEAPYDEKQAEAWERRIRFWTTCHEMGHLFNLAHSWDKEHGTGWLPQKNNEESLSFMNYPSYYPEDGQKGYFSRFTYRFDDDELLFMRHAPEEYVQMGNSSWLTNHAFAASDGNRWKLALQLRSPKNNNRYHFMEPVIIECKLKNVSTEDIALPFSASFLSQQISLVITDSRGHYHHHRPFFRSDYTPHETRLTPGESCYDWLFASADCDRWTIADPGTYTLQAFFHFNSEWIISEPMTITVAGAGKEAEHLAQDYFCNDIARIFAFDGSTVLSTDILEQCLDERSLPEPVACHTRLALASPLQYESRKLEISQNGEVTLRNMQADPDKALTTFNALLLDSNNISVETLGNIKYKLVMDNYCEWLTENDLHDFAIQCQKTLLATLENRNVKSSVLSEVKNRLFRLQTSPDRYELQPLT